MKYAPVFAIAAALSCVPASAATAEAPVTFTKDVLPILQNRCQVCHRPDTFAPMSLLTYQETRPWARSIKQKVLTREMPPWFVDKNVGVRHFKNDISLSDQEIATIVKWVDDGAPEGNPADAPPARKFDDEDRWHIGQPDLIVTLPEDRMVPAKGSDQWLDILVDPHITEDRYLMAVETKPIKGFKVVHHVISSTVNADGSDTRLNVGDTVTGTFLNEYALGKSGDIFPDGAGRLVKAGTKINFNMHLHSVGQAMAANVALGLKFYPRGYTPKHIEITQMMGSASDIDIPPNTDNVRSDGYTVLTKPTRILSYQPHMHNRGKASCMEAILPTGRVEPLSCVPHYQFAWHIVYLYAEDEQPLLPAGTVIHVTSWHDNTASNKYNPDPDAEVTFGQRTIDEMGFAWVSYFTLTDEEYKQQVDARKARQQQLAEVK